MKPWIGKILSWLKVRPPIGGLDISDVALHFVFFDGERWRLAGMRLEPGVMEAGRLKDRGKLITALKSLKTEIFGPGGSEKRVNAIISLSSISVYTQVFSLPIIEGENLERAIELNIQMVSPVESSEAYSGWQLVGEDKGSLRLEVLSASIERGVVDELNAVLFEAGFVSTAVESRALALTRLLREQGSGVDPLGSFMLVSLDSSGLDFVVVRRGQLYFEYFNPWRDITDEKGQVAMPAFEAALKRNLQQVLNFYSQHWTEPVSKVIISAIALSDEIKKIVEGNFSIPTAPLDLKSITGVGPEWFVALGCGLRGMKPRAADKEVSLLGIGAGEQFRREQFVEFAKLWRLMVPVSLGILFTAFVLADVFALETAKSLTGKSNIVFSPEQQAELSALTAKAQDFNASVAMIKSVERGLVQKSALIAKIDVILASSSISLDRLYFQSLGAPLILNGLAKSQDDVINFKNSLSADPDFTNVYLALTDIKPDPRGGYSFSLTFSLK